MTVKNTKNQLISWYFKIPRFIWKGITFYDRLFSFVSHSCCTIIFLRICLYLGILGGKIQNSGNKRRTNSSNALLNCLIDQYMVSKYMDNASDAFTVEVRYHKSCWENYARVYYLMMAKTAKFIMQKYLK